MPSVDVSRMRLFLPLVAALMLVACGKEGSTPDVPVRPPSEPGVLRIATEPGDARLYVDGALQGNSPAAEGETFAVRLPQGRHTIEALKPVDTFSELFESIELDVTERPLEPLVLRLRPRLTAAGEERRELEEQRRAAREQSLVARYRIDGATATDMDTGLMWMRCSLGQDWNGTACVGEPKRFTWGQALEAAEAFSHAGWSDWRLPDLDELHALTYCSSGKRFALDSEGAGGGCAGEYVRPTILSSVFPDAPLARYWSSNPHALYSYRAWGVAFTTGIRGAGGRGDYDHVRLVRDAR